MGGGELCTVFYKHTFLVAAVLLSLFLVYEGCASCLIPFLGNFIIPALFEEKAGILLYPRPSGRPSVRTSVMSHHCS